MDRRDFTFTRLFSWTCPKLIQISVISRCNAFNGERGLGNSRSCRPDQNDAWLSTRTNQTVLLRKATVALFVCVLGRVVSVNLPCESLFILPADNAIILQPLFAPISPILIWRTSCVDVDESLEWFRLWYEPRFSCICKVLTSCDLCGCLPTC